ncbi:hypothetical protein Aperf_G00000022454 [Anoplocephala perfoliata]
MRVFVPSPHLSALFFLYALQGVPYGLQSRFLPLVLRSHGSSLTSLGFYKLLHIPWALKSVYAPFVDSHFTRRRWLQCSIMGLFLCSAFLSFFSEIQLVNSTRLLPTTLLLFNFCAATLDIAVDSLAIGMLTHSELSHGNTAQVVGYKFGAVVGGGLLSWLSSFFSLSALFAYLCLFYLAGLWVATAYKRFSIGENSRKLSSEREHGKEEKQGYGEVLRTAIFDSPSTPALVLLLLVYKLGEMGAMNMLPLLLFDHGMPIASVGFWTGVIGQISSIIGSSSASSMLKHFGSTANCLQALFLSRIVTISLVTIFVFSVDFISSWVGVLLMNATLVVGGSITTTIFTLMMECTRREVVEGARATHYSILSTAEVLGKLIFAALGAAALTDRFGYPLAYLLFLLLNLIPPILLAFGRQRWPFLLSS